MNLGKDITTYIAELSKIGLSEEESTNLTKDLSAIVGYVSELEKVDTEGLEPTYQVTGLANQLRADDTGAIDYGVAPEKLLEGTREVKDEQIKVPKVL